MLRANLQCSCITHNYRTPSTTMLASLFLSQPGSPPLTSEIRREGKGKRRERWRNEFGEVKIKVTHSPSHSLTARKGNKLVWTRGNRSSRRRRWSHRERGKIYGTLNGNLLSPKMTTTATERSLSAVRPNCRQTIQ